MIHFYLSRQYSRHGFGDYLTSLSLTANCILRKEIGIDYLNSKTLNELWGSLKYLKGAKGGGISTTLHYF